MVLEGAGHFLYNLERNVHLCLPQTQAADLTLMVGVVRTT